MQSGTKYQYPFTKARYVETTAQPYVVFYAWHVQQELKKRIRVRVEGDTPQERQQHATRLMKEFNKKLAEGWHINDPDGFIGPQPETVSSDTPQLDFTLQQAFDFYKKVKEKELRESTLGLYAEYVKHLKSYLIGTKAPTLPLRRITPQLMLRFTDGLSVGARYQNNMLGWYKSFFDFWAERIPFKKHPLPKVERLRVDESDDHKPFNAEQAREIRKYILETQKDPQLWLFCQFIYYLFLRPGSELRLLRVGDLLTDQVKVLSGTAKNRRIGYVDIPTALQAEIQRLELRSYPPHYYVFSTAGKPGPKPVGKNYFYKRHVKALTALKLYGFDYDLYSWKPTGAIVLALDTKDALRVQRHCRHSTPDQTYTYLRKFGILFNQIRVTDFPALWE